MLIIIIIIFTLLLHQQTRHMKIRTETQNNHVHTLFSFAFCRVSSSLSTTVNLLILSSSTGVVFSDDYKSTKKSLDTKIRWVAKKNGSISCLGFPIHSTFLGVSIPISKNKAASKDSFAILLKPTTTTGGGRGGRYKPCSIDSTPAGRGSGPLRPISAMELQAEQVINAFRLLISLTEKERKTVF